jgi:tetratricopeptide (TPR) repeat protein
VEIRKKTSGADDRLTADALVVAGETHLRLGEFSKARDEFEEALRISDSLSGLNKLSGAAAIHGLADVALARSQNDKAEKQLKRFAAIFDDTAWIAPESVLPTLDKLASLYMARGANEAAEPIYRRILAMRRAAKPPNQLELARALGSLGACLHNQGKYAEAEPLARQNLDLMTVLKGADDPETISASINLARVYFRQEKWDVGRELMNRGLTYHTNHPEADPGTAASLFEEAGFVEVMAKSDAAAIPLLRRALELRRSVSGTDSPRTADVEVRLAKALARGNDFAAAKPLALHALSVRRTAFGEDANVAELLDLLGAAYLVEKDHGKAIEVLLDEVSWTERKLGSEAVSLAPVLDVLATEQLLVGKTEESWTSFQRSQAIAAKHGTKKPLELSARQIQFGWLLANQGELSRGALLLESGIGIRQRENGGAESDQATRAAMTQMAEVYAAGHDYDRANALLLQVLAGCEKELGPAHRETRVALYRLGNMRLRAEAYSKAAADFQKLAAMPESSPAESFDALVSLGATYVRQEDYKHALPVFKDMLALCSRNPKMLCAPRALYEVGNAYYNLGDVASAETNLRQSLALYEKDEASDESRAAIYYKLARMYSTKDLLAAAESNFIKSRALYETSKGPEDPWVSINSWQLGYLYFKQGLFEKALREFKRGVDIDNRNLDKARLLGSEFQLAQTLALPGLDDRYRHILSIPPAEMLDARSSLERRLDRAAASIEKSLEHVEDLQSMAPNGIARQIWMTHIGAFLANRITESNEGEEFVCLHPWCFADYVLRVCRALAGSKKVGGFLDKVAKTSWEGFDGDALTKGLSFLWTCVTWAAAYMVHYYSNGEGKEEIPESIAVASAELVAARFIWKVRAHCTLADQGNLKKRFPAWDAVPPAQMTRTETRLQQLAQLIADVETSGNKSMLGPESDTTSLKAGSLVHNPKLGVTMLALEGGCRPYRLVDLSHSSDDPVKFGALVTPVLFNGKPYELFQRTDESRI